MARYTWVNGGLPAKDASELKFRCDMLSEDLGVQSASFGRPSLLTDFESELGIKFDFGCVRTYAHLNSVCLPLSFTHSSPTYRLYNTPLPPIVMDKAIDLRSKCSFSYPHHREGKRWEDNPLEESMQLYRRS